MTDTVYLHTIAPALISAAHRTADFIAARLAGESWNPGVTWAALGVDAPAPALPQ
jgi:hypothetical protein